MVDFWRQLLKLIQRIRYQTSLLVHNRRLQARLQVGSALALGVGLVLSVLLFTGLFSSPQARFADFIYQPIEPSGKVAIVAIDDASLGQIGAWPWSPSTLATLLEKIDQAHPRVIALDFELSDSMGGQTSDNQAFAQVSNLILPIVGVNAVQGPRPSATLPRFDLAVGPSLALADRTVRFGHAMITPDDDGVVRRLPAVIQAAGHQYPALGLAAAELASNGLISLPGGQGGLPIGTGHVPLDEQNRLILKFTSPLAHNVISVADLIHSRVSAEQLRDKIVLVGTMSPTLSERFQTPLSLGSRGIYSVEIQADLVETLVSGHWLFDQDRLSQITMIFLLAILAGSTLIHVRLLSSIALAVLYFLAYLGYAFQKFADGILVQPLYPALALGLTLACTIIYRYFAEERARSSARRLFHRHIGPEAVDQVLGAFEAGDLSMRGVRREVTVLYVDLHESTKLIDSLSAEATIDLLNQYSKLVVECIFRNNGSLVKQLGNAIVSVWNLPLNQIDHVRRALQTAVEIRTDIKEANLKGPKELAISVGMGIATGRVVAGRMGAPGVAEYTIIGEVVTLAERLAARRDGTIFMNEAAFEQGGKELETRQLNAMRLRRKTDPLAIWELIEPMELEVAQAVEGEELV